MARKVKIILLEPNFPYAQVDRTANQAITTATQTIIQWDTVIAQNGLSYDATNFGFTVPYSGMYQISAFAQFVNIGVAASLGLGIRVNGITTYGVQLPNLATIAGIFSALHISQAHFLTAGDFVSIPVFQNSGTTRNLTPDGANNRKSRFSIFGLMNVT